MKTRLSHGLVSGVAVALLLAVAAASAQVVAQPAASPAAPGGPAATSPAQPGLTRAPSARLDHFLSQWLILGNRNEIDISRFAADHSQNSKVKNFAQQMVKDHTNFINKLQQTISMSAAVQTPGGMPAGSAMPGQAMLPSQRTFAQPGQPRAGTFGGRPSAEALPQSRMAGYPPSSAAGSDAEVVQLLQQWRSQFEPMLRSELERNRGANFDKAYLGQQIIEHISMLAALRASESQASPQLQPLITQAIQTTQQHLDQARSLMSQLESTPNQK